MVTLLLESLPTASSPTVDDLLYLVTDPGGTPADAKITLGDLAALVVGIVAPGGYARLGVDDEQIFGSSPNPNGASHQVPFNVSTHFNNPNKVITQAGVFFAFFTGTPGGSQGTFEGASAEANVYATSALTPAALGFEGIVHIDGVGGSIGEAIGLQGSAHVGGTSTITDLISVFGAGAFSTAGSPIVTNAYTFRAQEPTIGANRFTWQGIGRHRFVRSPSATGNVVEISNQTDLLQWANDGSKWIGYASDGASARLTLDPTDGTATGRLVSELFGSGKHISLKNGSSEVFAFGFDGIPKWASAGLAQTTVGAAGGASALPATPTKYLKVQDSAGATFVIAAYAAA